jgi:hypothetical protein
MILLLAVSKVVFGVDKALRKPVSLWQWKSKKTDVGLEEVEFGMYLPPGSRDLCLAKGHRLLPSGDDLSGSRSEGGIN